MHRLPNAKFRFLRLFFFPWRLHIMQHHYFLIHFSSSLTTSPKLTILSICWRISLVRYHSVLAVHFYLTFFLKLWCTDWLVKGSHIHLLCWRKLWYPLLRLSLVIIIIIMKQFIPFDATFISYDLFLSVRDSFLDLRTFLGPNHDKKWISEGAYFPNHPQVRPYFRTERNDECMEDEGLNHVGFPNIPRNISCHRLWKIFEQEECIQSWCVLRLLCVPSSENARLFRFGKPWISRDFFPGSLFTILIFSTLTWILLQILSTRFSCAPKLLVYDNCCNLFKYCMSRTPWLFKDTRFVVDRFHYRDHVGCSEEFNMDTYEELKNMNSEISEQFNSGARYGDLIECLSQKTQLHFMLDLQSYMYEYNSRRP